MGTLGLLVADGLEPHWAASVGNPIVIENQEPGSGGWQLGSRVADDGAKQIKGYASATSINKGESLTFYVTVTPAQSYTIDIYRIGWYGGAGGRQLAHIGPIAGTTQEACPPDGITGLIACRWSPGHTLAVPETWTTGVYVGVLTNAAGYQNYLIFVVRDDARPGALLYQQSVTTYQAYNNYPNDSWSGKSLYTENSYGANTVGGTPRAVKVSFDRPYAGNNGAGQFFNFEVNFVRWLERQGYDVTYTTDVDTHASGGRLLSARGFLSVGHDEYWSAQMYDAVRAARDAGVHLGFFGSDEIYWQIRLEPSASGAPNRVQVCYKDAAIDPVHGPTTTVAWADPLVNRPSQLLVGLSKVGQVPYGQSAGYVVQNSSHWVYAGTGFHDGDWVGGLVGYEMDGYRSQYALPESFTRTILSASGFTDSKTGQWTYANSAIYQAASSAWVFAAGTNYWSYGLDNLFWNRADGRIQQTTANILDAFLNGVLPTAGTVALDVGKAGSGDGFVTSAPIGIGCGAICSARFAAGTKVTLTATPARGSVFVGWSGGGCSGTGPCTVSPTETTSVTATFDIGGFALTVTQAGTGTGVVTSTVDGLTCPPACAQSFPDGTQVTLTVEPGPVSVFVGWMGCDTVSSGACTVIIDTDRAVTATFDVVLRPTLTLQLNAGSFRSGETLILTAVLTPGPGPMAVDGYVVLQPPGGAVLSLMPSVYLAPGLLPTATGFVPFQFAGEILRYTFTGVEPVGTYTWFAALTAPGTLSPVGALSQVSFSFSP